MRYKKSIELLRKYLIGKAAADENKKVDNWYNSMNGAEDAYEIGAQETAEIKGNIYQEIKIKLSGEGLLPKPVVRYRKLKWLAAAVLIAAISSTAFFAFKNYDRKAKPRESQLAKARLIIKPPASNKAVLKLADGTTIQLDSSGVGTLAVQGNVHVEKLPDGRIVYNGQANDEIAYNNISVPRGSTPIKLILADGSEVWLNVASSITYPTAFTGNERKVTITGEAYFEITRDEKMPFVVERANDDARVQVLGTHFNVNAYDDEAAIKVTLLEGAVDVSKFKKHSLLKPGQQARIDKEVISIVNDVDMEEVMAWKNGRFYFDGADIKTIMRQIEKWYDIQVAYSSDIKYSFVAKISRNENASEILQILELTDMVHFNIEGSKITVTD